MSSASRSHYLVVRSYPLGTVGVIGGLSQGWGCLWRAKCSPHSPSRGLSCSNDQDMSNMAGDQTRVRTGQCLSSWPTLVQFGYGEGNGWHSGDHSQSAWRLWVDRGSERYSLFVIPFEQLSVYSEAYG
ncbi:hypothetical protein LZ30DRAFT_262059 [Colletotrichum cereale]|nr:hypothetical protein LZ30DRAFT_262059 [Colletotrichum cereale]